MSAVQAILDALRFEDEVKAVGCDSVDCEDLTTCSKCDGLLCTEHTDSAVDCACGQWHHEKCASDCDAFQYWEHYSADEDRLSDERGGW